MTPPVPGEPDAADAATVELIRSILSRGSYQMPHERLPYSVQAHAVWEAIRCPVTAERDQLRDLLGNLWLYVNWRYTSKQLTTEQKEMWASAVEGWGDPEVDIRADRWWLCPTCGIDNMADPRSGPHEGCVHAEALAGGGADG